MDSVIGIALLIPLRLTGNQGVTILNLVEIKRTERSGALGISFESFIGVRREIRGENEKKGTKRKKKKKI